MIAYLNHYVETIFKSSVFLTYLIIVSLLSSFSCSTQNQNNKEEVRPLQVEGYRAESEPYAVTIRSTGELLAWEEVEIKTPVAGNVLNIHFKEGQSVNRGALLVEIDSRTWRAQVTGLKAQLESATSELQRREQLLEIEGASQEIYEQSKARVSDLQAQIEELNVRIDLANVRAPFGGKLGMRNFSLGAYLNQGEMITRLVQSDKIRIHFNVPSRYALLPRIDMMVKVVPSASQDTVEARIYAIEPGINPSSRSLNIRARLNNEGELLIPGDFAQVIFQIDRDESALLIPADAIIPELNTQIVYLLQNGIAKRQEVETGTRTRSRVHILNGLQPGDTLIVTGLMEVREGSPAQITQLIQGGEQ